MTLIDRLGALCAELAGLDPALAQRVSPVAAGLGEPLRLAVVGRVNAGKSTLVNALVGRHVAPTAAGECTRVVARYRYGSPDRAEVVGRDGTRRTLALVGGRLPDALPVAPEAVAHIDVFLQSAALRTKTLVDTPGLASATTDASHAAAADADAVLFLFRDAERLAEVDFLREFTAACGPFAAAGINAAGVLSHADLLTPGADGDPFAVARPIADRLARDRAHELAGVVPVSGLLAETARTGAVTDADARALEVLGRLAPAQRQLALAGHLLPSGIEAATLDRLVRHLGAYATTHPPAAATAADLLRWLEDTSGVAAIEALIADELVARADLLKSARALAALALAARGNVRAEALVEAVGLDPVAHGVRELLALQRLRTQDPESPALDALLAQLRTPPGAARDWAGRAAAAQAEATMALSPAEAEAWRVVARSCQHRMGAGEPAGAGGTR